MANISHIPNFIEMTFFPFSHIKTEEREIFHHYATSFLKQTFTHLSETKTSWLTTRDLADNRMVYKHKEREEKQIAFINYIERN